MGVGKEAWGWYPAGKVWVPIQVAIDGKLVIDPTAILDDTHYGTDADLTHAPTSNVMFDHNATKTGVHAAGVNNLFNTGDVITDTMHGVRTEANAHAHGDLSGVTSNQHHAQAHTLASHTTKAHAELTGVGADDHHVHWTSTEHTAVGDAAPHHARQHVISAGADHTGRIALTQMTTGAAGQVLTAQGAGSDPVYAAVAGGMWTLAQTLSPAGVPTISSSVLAVHDLWMLIIDVTVTDVASTELGLRLNGDIGNNYHSRFISGTTIAQTTWGSYYDLGTCYVNGPSLGTVYVRGKRGGTSNPVTINGGITYGYNVVQGLGGVYMAAADITQFTFGQPTITGKIKIYYMDY